MLAERQNVEINYCPQYRGVGLDRGEIDKIVERSFEQRPPRGTWGDRPEEARGGYEAHRDLYDDRQRSDHGGRRRKSWLGDISCD